MKKKIKDLTLTDVRRCCKQHEECSDCPLHYCREDGWSIYFCMPSPSDTSDEDFVQYQNMEVDCSGSQVERMVNRLKDLNNITTDQLDSAAANDAPITFALPKEAKEWMDEHCKHCHSSATAGEHFEFTFVPTGLGTITTVKCLICGEKFECDDF